MSFIPSYPEDNFEQMHRKLFAKTFGGTELEDGVK